ncbi:DUF4956 domain-containing protein [Desulfopila sp. IMCC35008]|uniref:DUF4956 domain-containing protein n=1 Tax=Desulfopila sp. IMCC35008 TaxID=2653858 RepID=UPI0013D3EDD2|nr:DUF4956 domain-containing protein [Desulfopila sp. IMCC35008]
MDTQLTDWLAILTGFGSKSMDEIGVAPFLGVMLISLFSAFFISLLYVRFYKARSTGSMIYRAFPLLGMSITAIFIAIQFSLPLSLGLLGALSIVRFRTPIKEPEEIGFIMLVVATSLCCATFNLLFLAIIHCCALMALIILRYSSGFLTVHQNDGMVIIDIPDRIYADRGNDIISLLETELTTGRLDSISQNQGQTVISYNFQTTREDIILQLQKKIHAINAEITLNFFYNRNQAI